MVMTEKDRREINDQLEAQKHSIRRFLTIKLDNIKHDHEKESQRNERDFAEIKELLMKMYGQSVDTHAEIEVLKTKYEFMGTKINDLQSSENTNKKNIEAHIKKMNFYVWLIDNKRKIIISLPFIFGIYIKLKEPLISLATEIYETFKIWS